MFENLRKAKDLIQKKLHGKKVRHLCYPYGIFFNERNCNGKSFGVVILDFIDVRL